MVVVFPGLVSLFAVSVMFWLKKLGYSIISVSHVPMHWGHMGFGLGHSMVFR